MEQLIVNKFSKDVRIDKEKLDRVSQNNLKRI